MAKALLILFGGRSMPNMLTIIHEELALVVALVSEDQKQHLTELRQSLELLYKGRKQNFQLDTSYIVNAFKLDEVYQTCMRVVEAYSDTEHPIYEWIFNVTAATKIMSLGAYKAATELNDQKIPIKCWYLDTFHASVVPLLGEARDNNIFHLTLEQYAAVYNCQIEPIVHKERREYYQKRWLPFARYLAEHPHTLDVLKDILKQMGGSPKEDTFGTRLIRPAVDETYAFLETIHEAGLLESLQRRQNSISIKFTSMQYHFLNGAWLEVYVWDAAQQLGIFSDCQWSYRIPEEDKPKDNRNELDVTLLYNAQLILIECKTGEKDFYGSDTIYKIDSLATLLGGKFVTKIVITGLPNPTFLPAPDNRVRGLQNKFDDLTRRAKGSHVVIVTREDLPDLGRVLRKQAEYPDYSRS
jgi:Card1-like endonuclease family protein